ncbi:MAG: cysteine desulfurase [Eubacteriaceae bacterium]|jgi:cysteine desulfurase|nr:cysteine desulfurase [Eubacteriaceae bacterium]
MADCYFDNAASTKPFEETVDAYATYMSQNYANPSALHKKGMQAEGALRYAEGQLLRALGLKRGRAIFTSGATEAANLAIGGVLERSESLVGKSAVTTAIEHPCVSEAIRHYQSKGADAAFVPVDRYGQVDRGAFLGAIGPTTAIVSFIWVNNEFGSVQDVAALAKAAKEKNPKALIHVDCVQGFGKLAADFSFVDMMTVSSHKFHGPKGVGALICREGISLAPLSYGGGQQGGVRSGTVDAPAIYAMGHASETMDRTGYAARLAQLGEFCYAALSGRFAPEYWNSHKNGFSSGYAPHIFSLSFPGLKGEVLVHMLEEEGIYVSTASACSSAKPGKASPLLSIGCDSNRVDGALRISLSAFNTEDEIEFMVSRIAHSVERLARIMGKALAK